VEELAESVAMWTKAVEEVLDGTLPYLAEKRLKEA